MTEEPTTIPYEFKKYGYRYTLIVRNRRVVMYATMREGKPAGYEVMIVQNKPDAVIKGRPMKGGEALPSSSQWGIFGWSYLATQEEEAKARFAKSCERFNKAFKPVRRIIRRIAR